MLSPAEPVRLVQVGAGADGPRLAPRDRPVTRRPARRRGRPRPSTPPGTSAADAGFTAVAVATTLEELLDRVEADAVVNVTIPEAHAEVSTVALLRGLAVLCEKPLADTLPSGPVDDRRPPKPAAGC